jgi:peptidoglycan/xylan/chitin deacetylase (PgdA/CDA1 family)
MGMTTALTPLLALAFQVRTGPAVEVAPWNGHPGAVSLTFDDGDPSHLDVGIPELDRRGLKGTFYLVTGRLERVDEWKRAAEAGHEMASHTTHHRNAKEIQDEAALALQIDGAAKDIERIFGRPSVSFAYPYSAVTPAVKERVARVHLLGRGGGGPHYLAPSAEPDWFQLPSQVTLTATPLDTYRRWVDEAERSGTWTTLMIHGLGDKTWGWQPITHADYAALLDHLKASKVWTAPLAAVGAYWKAQKLFEKIKPEPVEGGRRWTWTLPERLPAGVVLKIHVPMPATLLQSDVPLERDADGLHSVRMDAGELVVRPAP